MKSFKKSIGLIMAIIMLITSCQSVFAVGDTTPEYGSCEVHTYPNDGKYTVSKAPTCSAKGQKFRKCSVCGEFDIVEIPKNPENHSQLSVQWQYDPEPTCSSEGVRFKVCYACNEKSDISTVPADPSAHKSATKTKEVIKSATCVSEGEKAFKCTYCNTYYDNEIIPTDTSAHFYNDDSVRKKVKDATCAKEGEIEWYCDYCGKLAGIEKLPPHNMHTPSAIKYVDKEANCSEMGIEAYHCTVCNTSLEPTDIPVNPNNHIYTEDYIIDIPATCSSEGEKSKHCTLCDAKKDITVIPIESNAHVYSDEWIITTEPTCSQSGEKHRSCTLCGYEQIPTIIDKLPHTYGDYDVIKVSADKTSAQVKYTCTVCGNEVIDIIKYGDNPGEGDIGNGDIDPKIKQLVQYESSILKVDYDTMTISNIAKNTTLSEFYQNFANGLSFVMLTEKGEFLGNESFVGTGHIFNFIDAEGNETNYYLCVLGDVDSNGNVTANDARAALRAGVNLDKLEGVYFSAADVNGDGKITATDARKILRVSMLLEFFDSTYKDTYGY